MLNINELDNGNKAIIVPKGIRYISDWKDYNLSDFNFPHILDKKIPGCGYTEYCITSNLNVILCSPRKILLENKEMQHPSDVYYFRNELDFDLGTDKDISKITKASSLESKPEEVDKERLKSLLQELKTSLNNYITRCIFNNIPAKILVTYDSFRIVRDVLEERKIFDSFYVVIDEMQSVFTDSTFKSDTELGLLSKLRDLQKVCFVSATPMIDRYLRQVQEFKDLPYYELDWETEDPLRVVRPDLRIRSTNSITSSAEKIINEYKANNFEEILTKDGGSIISNEAVFYVNSVNNIISIIKRCDLKPDECNILCANTRENSIRIKRRLSKDFEIGKVPLRGEQHKMFTFCTRTVYLGADFYSTCARTYVLSDANIETLTVDITLDLPQILGRQRLSDNPWKNRAELYYKPLLSDKAMSREEFDEIIRKKIEKTESILRTHNNALDQDKQINADNLQYIARSKNYRDDYVAVDVHDGNVLVPKFNNLVMVSQQRAFDIQQVDYKDRFSVFNTIRENKMIDSQVGNNVALCLNEFNEAKNFPGKMKILCEYPLSEAERYVFLDQVPIVFKMYYEAVGPDRCKALSYNKTEISRELKNIKLDRMDVVTEKILEVFLPGNKLTKVEIKNKLSNIYSDLGYTKTAKASDLEEYFELRSCQITNKETGKREHGFEIIKKK